MSASVVWIFGGGGDGGGGGGGGGVGGAAASVEVDECVVDGVVVFIPLT